MFELVQPAPADPIFGLSEAYAADPRSDKINLTVGIYKDEDGRTPVLASVRIAQARVMDAEKSKSYAPIPGAPAFGRAVRQLLFGADHPLVDDGRAFTAHCAGGTGALRIAGAYMHALHPQSRLWHSQPTWANHGGIYGEVGMELCQFPYLDAAGTGLDFEAMCAALQGLRSGDVVLLHGCCHNPTGIDPTPEQWREIGRIIAACDAMPLVDFAYQGFAVDLEADAAGLRAIAAQVDEFMVCSSFSKNFGLYNGRVGAVTVVAGSSAAAAAVGSHINLRIRRIWSNPPAHGAAIVTTIMGDAALHQQWLTELAAMRDRIVAMRSGFVAGLAAEGVMGFEFIGRQHGMFSMTGLSGEQVDALRTQHGVYALRNGRVNFAGMTQATMPRLCRAIAAVLAD